MTRVEFAAPLVAGRLLGRRKRFFADVEVNGRAVVAHCPNPGSMRGNLEIGSTVWLEDRQALGKPGLPYRWMAVAPPGTDGDDACADWICVDTGLANPAVAAVLKAGEFPGIGRVAELRSEYPIDVSRLDFQVWAEGEERPTFIEVKSVSLRASAISGRGRGEFAFPDSPTERGRKHLELLAELALAGEKACLCFAAIANEAGSVRAADEIDPNYGRVLRDAKELGVEVITLKFRIDRKGLSFSEPLPFNWAWRGDGPEKLFSEVEGEVDHARV